MPQATKAKKSNVPDNETKADKFKRLANFRVNKVIKGLRQVGALSNTNSYEYEKAHAEKIVSALRAEVEKIEKLFSGEASKAEGFNL